MTHERVGLLLGPLVFLFFSLTGQTQTVMPEMAWYTAGIGLWMAIWWATEAIPVPATAFIPLVTFSYFGIASFKDTAASFAHPIIFLFLGAFFLALAIERWNLHRRVALKILSYTGTDGKRLIAGFMLTAAFLSMWMTNTSTTMMLLPIGLSVAKVIVDSIEGLDEQQSKEFYMAMLLGLAYGSTIGGLSTLIGTPPNALLAAFLKDNYGIEIDFLQWMMVGVPVSLIMLPLGWYVLTHITFNIRLKGDARVAEFIKFEYREMGAMTSAEKRVALIFLLVVLGWILRRPLSASLGVEGLSDSAIAMTGALLLFLVPASHSDNSKLITWHESSRLPWGVLILFGGGLALASAVSKTGLAAWLGGTLEPLTAISIVLLLVCATILVIFLTELTSNLATTATFLPVIAALSLSADISPLLLTVPVALAASCAFMLPVATPPNAIVFSSGHLTIPTMIRCGLILNLIGTILLSIVAIWLVPLVFGVV